MTEPQKAMIKTLGVIMFGVMMLLIVLDAEATGKNYINLDLTINHDYQPPPPSSETVEVYTGMDNDEFDKGMAMSAAGDTCVFDYAPGWQGCFGWGNYGSANALNGSLVTRIDNFAVRINLQSDTDFDEQAIGAGGSWHF